MEEQNEKLNIFAEPIILKKHKIDLTNWIKKCILVHRLNKISPNFNTLIEIWNFVYLMHLMYMHSYREDSNLHLFLGILPKKAGNNVHCMIYREESFNIKFLLEKTTNKISIEIDRNSTYQSKNAPEQISFIDGEYQFINRYDEEKFRTIISCLMTGVKELINYYYKNKRF